MCGYLCPQLMWQACSYGQGKENEHELEAKHLHEQEIELWGGILTIREHERESFLLQAMERVGELYVMPKMKRLRVGVLLISLVSYGVC